MNELLNKDVEAGNVAVHSSFNDIFLKLRTSLKDVHSTDFRMLSSLSKKIDMPTTKESNNLSLASSSLLIDRIMIL